MMEEYRICWSPICHSFIQSVLQSIKRPLFKNKQNKNNMVDELMDTLFQTGAE